MQWMKCPLNFQEHRSQWGSSRWSLFLLPRCSLFALQRGIWSATAKTWSTPAFIHEHTDYISNTQASSRRWMRPTEVKRKQSSLIFVLPGMISAGIPLRMSSPSFLPQRVSPQLTWPPKRGAGYFIHPGKRNQDISLFLPGCSPHWRRFSLNVYWLVYVSYVSFLVTHPFLKNTAV